MFIYQDGKLYVQYGDKAVGVEICSDGSINKVANTECEILDSANFLTPFEVRCKYNMDLGGTYVFPIDSEELIEPSGVIESDPTAKLKTRSRKKS